jgi:hypothetical protein
MPRPPCQLVTLAGRGGDNEIGAYGVTDATTSAQLVMWARLEDGAPPAGWPVGGCLAGQAHTRTVPLKPRQDLARAWFLWH